MHKPSQEEIKELFLDNSIGDKQPDEIFFDVEEGDHKFVRYQSPPHLDEVATFDAVRKKWGYYYKKNAPIYAVVVHMYEHKEKIGNDKKPIDIRVGEKRDIELQALITLKKKDKRLRLENPSE
jgi:hypothetical protein